MLSGGCQFCGRVIDSRLIELQKGMPVWTPERKPSLEKTQVVKLDAELRAKFDAVPAPKGYSCVCIKRINARQVELTFHWDPSKGEP